MKVGGIYKAVPDEKQFYPGLSFLACSSEDSCIGFLLSKHG